MERQLSQDPRHTLIPLWNRLLDAERRRIGAANDTQFARAKGVSRSAIARWREGQIGERFLYVVAPSIAVVEP